MPQIAKREMTPVEKALQDEVLAGQKKLRDAMAADAAKGEMDIGGLAGKGAGNVVPSGTGKGKSKGGGIAAVEARFLGGGENKSPYKKLENLSRRQLAIQEKQLRYFARKEKRDKILETKKINQQVMELA